MSKHSQREVSFFDMGAKDALAGYPLSIVRNRRWRHYGSYRKGWYSVNKPKDGMLTRIFKKLFRRY